MVDKTLKQLIRNFFHKINQGLGNQFSFYVLGLGLEKPKFNCETKSLILVLKIIVLFVAGIYILGMIYFPLLGVGNYQLVRIDYLLFSEWVFLTVVGVGFVVWSFKLYLGFSKQLLERDICITVEQLDSDNGKE